MQCPICKKDLEIKNKKIGENEAGEAIYNEFAICRDCKKQWNLDKQREKKKSLQKKHWLKKQLKPVRLQKSHTKSARLPKEKNFCRTSCPAKEKEKTSEPGCRRRKTGKKTSSEDRRFFRRTAIQTASKETPCYFRPSTSQICRRSGRKPGKSSSTSEKKRPEEAKPVHAIDNSSTRIISDEEDELKITAPDLSTPEGEKEQTYSNIPPKHVREKREQEMRENYQNMLDEEDDDDERHFPVVLVVILIFLIIAAAAFAGYWFFLK